MITLEPEAYEIVSAFFGVAYGFCIWMAGYYWIRFSIDINKVK
jgi:nitrate reductase NapE component